MSDQHTIIAAELSLMLFGLGMLWRFVLSPAARKSGSPGFLPKWEISGKDFFLFAWIVIGGGLTGSLVAGSLMKLTGLGGDAAVSMATATGQLGLLAGIGLGGILFARQSIVREKPTAGIFGAGLVTFLISLPVVTAVNLIWQGVLQLCGLPAEKQDLIRMFVEAESPLLLVVMIALACVGAPIVEELVFRGGLFRFARGRLPRWAAFLLPACLFAALHQNLASFAPLVALGMIFSLAYERTGRIGTSMVAHALFNLNAVLLIFGEVDV